MVNWSRNFTKNSNLLFREYVVRAAEQVRIEMLEMHTPQMVDVLGVEQNSRRLEKAEESKFWGDKQVVVVDRGDYWLQNLPNKPVDLLRKVFEAFKVDVVVSKNFLLRSFFVTASEKFG